MIQDKVDGSVENVLVDVLTVQILQFRFDEILRLGVNTVNPETHELPFRRIDEPLAHGVYAGQDVALGVAQCHVVLDSTTYRSENVDNIFRKYFYSCSFRERIKIICDSIA